jgi:predicted oxidoreductase (fatty acid repression mutant protein)
VGNAAGMLQYMVWTALECAGMGANLQHFPQLSPVTAPVIGDVLGTPKNWVVSAMIPFGEKTAEAAPRTYNAVDDKVLVIQ